MFTLPNSESGNSRPFRGRFKSASRTILVGALALLVLSACIAVLSLYPVAGVNSQIRSVIDSTFEISPGETYRQGLGSFHGDENLTLLITGYGEPVNFTLLTYGGPRYSNLTDGTLNYSFPAGADYYEAVFQTNATSNSTIHLQVSQQRLSMAYPYACLGAPAKTLFVASWGVVILLLILPMTTNNAVSSSFEASLPALGQKNRRRLKIALLVSLVFWLALLAVNTFPLATFENWYTDSARNTYTANLFPKVGLAVFDTPLSRLSSADLSFYKFVTWPEMPHLYPLGSIFLYLPFGWLIEQGASQALVFKLEILVLLVAAHVCMYQFLKRFWRQNLDFAWKAVVVYFLYIALVVYSADGMFDTVAFLFAMFAVMMFLEDRYDVLLLLVAVSSTFKYQAGIFLLPLVLVSLQKLLQQGNPWNVLKNKMILAAAALVAIDLFTAFLSLPYLTTARPELVMNGVNAFSSHAQVPWWLQAFAVLLTLTVTLILAVYLQNRSRLTSLFMVFSLLPCFTMPYFQPWYLPFFFVIALFPREKRALEVTVAWLVFMVIVLSYGGFSFNPVQLLDNIRRVLGL
jgi:hypothetical protein